MISHNPMLHSFFFNYTTLNSMILNSGSIMKINYSIGLLMAGMLTGCLISSTSTIEEVMISENIKSIEDVKALFPQSPQEIAHDTDRYIAETKKAVDAIIAIPHNQRTFANTAKALDDILARSNLKTKINAFEMMTYLHPDQAMRDRGHDAVKKIKEFSIDNISNNKQLYEAFKAYVDGNAKKELLNDEQQYFLEQTMKSFKRAGLDLPDEKLEHVKKLEKKLSDLTLTFDRTIDDDNRTIIVNKAGLAGLDDDFIVRLTQTDDGNYLLGVDYPTYFQVMEHSDVEDTRKRLFEAFSSRAYPTNEKLLAEIVAVRDELACLLGFESFAAFNIDDQMAQSPAKVDAFLQEIRACAQKKTDQELVDFTRDLPSSVTLTKDGKIKAWDIGRIKSHFKEHHFNIDERKIAEYFPVQSTINALLDIYRQFMGVDFKEVPITDFWHPEVRLIEAYDNNKNLLGYLLLDLHPRANKYSHAAHGAVTYAITLPDSSRLPMVSIVMANFPKPSKDKPALLMRLDVNTFFHEFGHAMHSLLGATQMGSFAGTHVKVDFVEMPSQMLEEWLWDKEILKKVSKHYKTGEPLPDALIDNIMALKRYDAGNFVLRQTMLAQYALDLHKKGAQKDPEALWRTLAQQIMPQFEWGSTYRSYASFGHLTGYGAKYYGYLWSKVFALDLFNEIKKHGLLNPVIGARYVQEVIGKGGSKDPNVLLTTFLGRQPSQDAFLKDLGLQ